jgi:chromosome segregation ATPase
MAEASSSSKNDFTHESGACMENLLKIGSITDKESLLLHQQSRVYTKHRSKKTSSRATEKSGLLTKKKLCSFNKNSRKKKKLSLEIEIKALEREARNLTFVIMYGRRHINFLKKKHEDLRKKLQNDWYKKDVINVERNSLVRQVNTMTEKWDWLSSTVRSTECEVKILKTERDLLKLEVEKLRGHCKDSAALGDGLSTLATHCDEPSEEPRQQRDNLIPEAKNQAAYIETIQKDKNALKLEMEHLRTQCMDAAALKKDRDRLTLAARRQAKYTKDIEEEREALKLEAEHLRTQLMEVAALKEQLNIATVQRHKLGRDRRTLVVIIIVLVLCIFVGLLWTQRDSLNTYGTLFASLNKTSSHNSILATVVPSRDIVV